MFFTNLLLQTELQALTDLHKMSEEMYSSLSSNNADTEKKVKALIAENKTLTVSLKDQNEDNEILKVCRIHSSFL